MDFWHMDVKCSAISTISFHARAVAGYSIRPSVVEQSAKVPSDDTRRRSFVAPYNRIHPLQWLAAPSSSSHILNHCIFLHLIGAIADHRNGVPPIKRSISLDDVLRTDKRYAS